MFSRLLSHLSPPPPRLADVAATLLGRYSVSLLDVGARWGAKRAWYNLSPFTEILGFEPDPEECARLNATRSVGEEFFPCALGASDTRATLHVTQEPGCSSLYPPDVELATRYPGLSLITPVRTMEVELATLDRWAENRQGKPIVFMKLDVQGAELDVLKGASKVLKGCMGLEVEVEFSPIYRGQPLFADVDTFLRNCGFTLWRLGHLVHYGEGDSSELNRTETAVYSEKHVQFKAGGGRLFWGHALYFRDFAGLEAADYSLLQALSLAALLEAASDLNGRDQALQRLLGVYGAELSEAGRTTLAHYASKFSQAAQGT